MFRIRVYNDYLFNNQMLINRLVDVYPTADIITLDSADILAGQLQNDIDLLVMPGGADLNFCEKLNGAGNAAIKRYVAEGGAYLGICAGAYYGAKALNWAEDENEHAISGARELSFIDCTAIGPLYSYLQDGRFDKSWDGIAPLIYKEQKVMSLYRGGCAFEQLSNDVTVLARYEDDGRAAIVGSDVQKGRVVLSGPHIECRGMDYTKMTYKNGNESYGYMQGLATQLNRQNDAQDALWRDILAYLLDRD